MKHLSGFKLLEEREGAGTPTNKGDEVRLNETQPTHLSKEMIRVVDGVTLIDHTIVLGRREAMAGAELALNGYESRRLSKSPCKSAPDLSR